MKASECFPVFKLSSLPVVYIVCLFISWFFFRSSCWGRLHSLEVTFQLNFSVYNLAQVILKKALEAICGFFFLIFKYLFRQSKMKVFNELKGFGLRVLCDCRAVIETLV